MSAFSNLKDTLKGLKSAQQTSVTPTGNDPIESINGDNFSPEQFAVDVMFVLESFKAWAETMDQNMAMSSNNFILINERLSAVEVVARKILQMLSDISKLEDQENNNGDEENER